jgi:hypothetical protein
MVAESTLMIGIEGTATYGTYAPPTRAYEFTGEGLDYNPERINSAAWQAGQRVISSSRWKPGQVAVAGNVDLEVASKNFGIWFKHALGACTTTTTGTITPTKLHTCTLGDLLGLSMTVQVGIEDTGGTVNPLSFLGCKVNTLDFKCAVGELLTISVGLIGQDMVTNQSLGTAGYADSPELFSFVEGTLAVAGTGGTANPIPVRDFSMSINNQLPTDDYILGSALMREPTEPALREITGTMDADFASLMEFNRFKNANEATLTALFKTSTAIETGLYPQVLITANVRYDGETPKVSGVEQTRQPIAYTVTAPASGEPISVAYQSSDTNP